MPQDATTALRHAVPTLVAAAAAMPREIELAEDRARLEGAAARGYFFPDEEELVRLRYAQYLALRGAMVETLSGLEAHVGRHAVDLPGWRHRLPVFATAFAAACILDRADRYLVGLASECSVVWKKLDEEDRANGIPRKTFTRIYKQHSHPRTLTRLVLALEFYRRQRDEIRALAADPVVGPVVSLLLDEEPWMDGRVRRAVRRRAAYRWFSFLRRHRSAWKKVLFGIFEVSGRTVADLRVPGVKRRGEPKRVDAAAQQELQQLLEPGDVVVTRHDDALSNLFLPGFWPHVALFLGQNQNGEALAEPNSPSPIAGPCFLEAKADGVRVRPYEETLQVDALLVLRPPLQPADVRKALERALSHAGKGYDFLFDFRTADRLVCTEVAYRGYHGIGPVAFELREVGGRLCLPAEEFISQAMSCGFELVAAVGLGGREASTAGGREACTAGGGGRFDAPGGPPAKRASRVLVGAAARQAFEQCGAGSQAAV